MEYSDDQEHQSYRQKLPVQVAAVKETEFKVDEVELEKRRVEAEEKRMAELRALGTPVTVETFAAWKQK